MRAGAIIAVSLLALVFLSFSQVADAKNKKRAAEYHVPTTSSSSSSDSSSSSLDYTTNIYATSTSPISAGESGWDTATSTSFDPNVWHPVGNKTAEKAFAFTSSPASTFVGFSVPAILCIVGGFALLVEVF